MSDLINNYPPGPCGQCGAPDSVYIVGTSRYDYDHQEQTQEMYSGGCDKCEAQLTDEYIEYHGDKRGYAFGLPGHMQKEAMDKAGWTRMHRHLLI